MKKTILFLINKEVTYLPPFMTILDCLSEEYSLKVISRETKSGRVSIKSLYKDKDVTFLETTNKREGKPLFIRVFEKLRKKLYLFTRFHKEALHYIKTTPHDILWVIHEETAFEFRRNLVGKQYLISLYELNDHRIPFLKKLKPVLQNAQEVIVPEYNRACILRVWTQLRETPTVVPNKPSIHPLTRFIQNTYSELLAGKKIILYQGLIYRRWMNFDNLCEAIQGMPDYCIVLLGKGDTAYIEELKSRYSNVIHIPFINPPEHLYVTSYAHIALVKYDFIVLNAIFCAPNKIWEYTGFGIPVLAHDIPGLQYTIGQYKAGVCANLDNKKAIKEAIIEIENNYDTYSRNAKIFYNSFDVKQALMDIAKRNMKK